VLAIDTHRRFPREIKTRERRDFMNRPAMLVGCLIVAAAVIGCAGVRVTAREGTTAAATHVRPNRVLVYDFAAGTADLPPGSALAQLSQERARQQSDKEAALGRRLGELTAVYLVAALNKAGVPALDGSTGALPRIGDGVVRGAFVTVDEGSRMKRMLIGFGSGAAKLETMIETFEVTSAGLVPSGSAQIETTGGKMPGMLVPVGAGAVAGSVATSAAISGTSNVLQEAGPESIEAAAKRTAEEIAKIVAEDWKKRGWL
jgi:hypothetical protein